MSGDLKLFVGNLPKSADETLLRPYFMQYGEIENFHILRDRDPPRGSRGLLQTFFESVDFERAQIVCRLRVSALPLPPERDELHGGHAQQGDHSRGLAASACLKSPSELCKCSTRRPSL